MQLLENVLNIARSQPGKRAVSAGSLGDQSLSYGELVERCTQYLTHIDPQRELLFVIANRGVELACAIVAGLMAEVPVAIIDPRGGAHRIKQMLSRRPGSQVFVDDLGLRLVQDWYPQPDICRFSDVSAAAVTAVNWGMASKPHSPHKTAIVLFTSGSTGEPKGVCISRGDLDSRLENERSWFGLIADQTTLGVLPLSFDVGITQLLGTLFSGQHHVLLNSWLPKDIMRHIVHFGAAGLALSPVVWKNLINFAGQDELWAAINSMRYITVSGGRLSQDELEFICSRLAGCGLIKTYGQTEMFRIASVKIADAPEKLASVGRAYPGVEIEVRDAEGKLCEPDVPGEIWARGSGAMQFYLDETPGQSEKMVAGFIRTGDFGYLDAEGYLHIQGRKDEMVKILDQRVFPDDVANSLQSLLNLSHVVVVAQMSSDGEAFLVAFFKQDELKLDDAELRQLMQRNLASHLLPKMWHRVPEFPITANGKIDKPGLLSQGYLG